MKKSTRLLIVVLSLACLSGLPARAQSLDSRAAVAAPAQADTGSLVVLFNGTVVPGVLEVSGIDEVIEYKDGDDRTLAPGNLKPGKLTITREWTGGKDWYNWFSAPASRRKSGQVDAADFRTADGTLTFTGLQPVKWSGPSFNSRNSGHAVEKLEVSWETFEYKGK
jgi:hypothetical protein